jgi:hypothetical protein
MKIYERKKLAMAAKICFKCLKLGHLAPDCKAPQNKCSVEGCKNAQTHHTLLHVAMKEQ